MTTTKSQAQRVASTQAERLFVAKVKLTITTDVLGQARVIRLRTGLFVDAKKLSVRGY